MEIEDINDNIVGHLENGVLTINEGIKTLNIQYISWITRKYIEKVILPLSLKEIEEGCFKGCSALEEVIIPNNVNKIGKSAFEGCGSLKKVVLSKTIEEIPIECFRYCESLKHIIIPDSVKKMEYGAFFNTDLEYLYLSKNIDELDIDTIRNVQRLILLKKNMTNNVWNKLKDRRLNRGENRGTYFREIVYIDNKEKPKTRRPLEQEDIKNRESLENIVIEGVDSIGPFTLAECQNLKKVVIGKEVKCIDIGAFASCPNLESVVIISDKLEYVGDYAFEDCKKLQQIVFKSDMTQIGYQAFCGCESLRYVDMQGIELGSIGEGCFKGCKNLEAVFMPDTLKVIGKESFKDCSELISIRIPKGVKIIGESAFENCCLSHKTTEIPQQKQDGEVEMIETDIPDLPVFITIPKTVTEIGERAFKGCKHLMYVHAELGSQLQEIKKGTFEGCEKLEAIDMPSNLKIIGDRAFYNCNSLGQIELPNGCEQVGDQAFLGCSNLRLVLTNGEIKHFANSFEDTNIANLDDLKLSKYKKIADESFEVITKPKSPVINFAEIKKVLTKERSIGHRND